jgi:GT2 family glycosyltransferase/glycosyltransferase involved in cell wall biosynthesis
VKSTIPGRVSVILVNFRGAEDTLVAIEALRSLDWPAEDLEIIVVENASGDDSASKLKKRGGDIVLVESSTNLGFAGGCNLGARHATGEFLAFLNNDARPDERWIRAAVDTFASGRDIAAVASKVLDWEGERVDYVDASITWYGMGYKPHAGERDRGDWDRERDVLFGTGAAMFVRAEVYAELEGFDEDYFMFYEDVDFGWRLNLLGYRFRFQPASLAFHKHHASISAFGDFREQYLLERNALATLYKNLDEDSLREVLAGAVLLAVRRATGRGLLDTTSLDVRVAGRDDERAEPVDKSVLAGIYGIDQFVELLPSLTASREKVQRTRVRSDRELRSLFGKTDEPAFPIEPYLDGYDRIMAALGIGSRGPERRRILIVTGDPIGPTMAGPAIRASNIARLLAREHEVRLLSLTRAESIDDSFSVGVLPPDRPKAAVPHERWADILIVQGHALELFPAFARSQKRIVADIYDPLHLEQLEQGRQFSLRRWNDQITDSTATLNQQLAIGDFFLCASERQRHFWLGQLAAVGRINAYTYSRDAELESLIAVVPFGIPSDPPVVTAPGARGTIPGIGADDKLIVWGGGLYDWFDPETLIRAVAKVAAEHDDIRLLFMGVKHPNPAVPEMEAVRRTRALSDQLGLTGRHVFFNESWVPYELRQNYLLEADAGVSTHFQHVETVFSFRTRILDYLWAGLPIISTEGDSFGDLVREEGLGAITRERDVEGLRAALERVLYDPEANAQARSNVARIRERFTWERVLEPLLEYCRDPQRAADKEILTSKRDRDGKGSPAIGTVKPPPARHGLRRDIDRTLYYLRHGGPSAVAERLKARRDRVRGSAR